ncbi:MAG: diguanylate cyclase [Lachnospiraceae bacterium]|nr:diguanylate cyclase [Lachnospiraceae bacterium]
MHNLVKPLSRRYSLFLFLGILFTLLFTLLPSVCYESWMPGVPSTPVECMDSGWTDENGVSVGQLPCSLDSSGSTLCLTHDLSDIVTDAGKVFVFRTRYETIRVWADDTLVYETAQGEEHALGSRWHFIPAGSCKGASLLRVEFTRYEEKNDWYLSTVFIDHPAAVLIYLLDDYASVILFCVFSVLFTLLLLFIVIFMAKEKMPGMSAILALAVFVFLSGQWVLLDSKITTLLGGNYALTYFFSYCVFYLLMVPFLLYIQLMLDCKNRILRYLPWAFIGNAVVCMGLHLFGVVSIQNTTGIVHILMVLAIFISTWELFHSVVKWREGKTIVTFYGILLVYAVGLLSIILYNAGFLRPANNAVLYSWALLILILSMSVDAIFSFGRMWKQKQYIEHYRQMAIQDSMTLLKNRNAYELHLQKIVSDPPRRLTFILFDVDNLKMINDTYGHHVGDQIIYLSAQCVREIFEPYGNCYRIGGDEFCVILNCAEDIPSKLSQFDVLFKSRSKDVIPTTVSYGWKEKAFDKGAKVTMEDIAALQNEADENLYRHKKANKAAFINKESAETVNEVPGRI